MHESRFGGVLPSTVRRRRRERRSIHAIMAPPCRFGPAHGAVPGWRRPLHRIGRLNQPETGLRETL